MKFTTLLPAHTTAGTGKHRPSILHDDHDAPTVQVSGRAMRTTDDSEVLRVRLWSGEVEWVALAIGERGDLLGLSAGARWKDAKGDLGATLAIKGYGVVVDDYATLFTPRDAAFDAPRRSSVLVDDPGRWQLSGKLLTADTPSAEEDRLLQLRVWIADLGWNSLVLTAYGDVVAHTVAATEKDAWKAAQAVMRRKGYIV
jgi:hypothetical protein